MSIKSQEDHIENLVQNKNNRSLYLDIIKGFAIILVVYGHCIEYYSDEYLKTDFITLYIVFTCLYSCLLAAICFMAP